jgi:hypothetical protein
MRLPALLAAAAVAAATLPAPEAQPLARERRMSFHNRLLLNRAVLSGLPSIEVLLLVEMGAAVEVSAARVSARVAELGGRIRRTDSAIGYLRVEVPAGRLVALVDSPDIVAYQIASLSRGAWYRDAPPLRNAEIMRGFEVTPIGAVEPPVSRPDLPPLSLAESRERGFTADDVGVGEWLTAHPTFDGRGVTIALLENALPSFGDPTVRSAKTIDGRDVPKIAGILNVPGTGAADETRVELDTIVDARTTWTRIGRRTYLLPRAGTYRFGLLAVPAGGNAIHQFAIVEDPATRSVWLDTNGDASFQDEAPLADVNERFDPRPLSLSQPRKVAVQFVMARGHEPHVVHIYVSIGSHQSMTLSVAAGSRSDDGLAFGVAPNARVLLVRVASPDPALAKMFEACIAAAQRPDVDVIGASLGIGLVPDTAADFSGALMERLVAVYQKPIVWSAANTSQMLGSVHAYGDALSVGGILSPQTYAALFGGRALARQIVHPVSAAGPALDGAIKPDFLAPMERLAADLPWNADIDVAPRNRPTRRLPPGYQISCCTSATSPYAAGVLALMISAAKQSNVPYNANALSRAMRTSARLVPGFQAHQQGNGALDINAAWRALVRGDDPARISASAAIVHPLSQYAARGSQGTGILEIEGWTPGMAATRAIVLRRDSGPGQPVTYQVDWSADDGTFSSARSVTLPLQRDVPLPIRISAKTPGAHSGLLTLRDPNTGGIVFRTQATIVATEPLDRVTATIRFAGTVGLMGQRSHYFHVPGGVRAIAFELRVLRGVIRPTIVAAHGLFAGYYMHVHPNNLEFMGTGIYRIVLPNPKPGTWTFRIDTGSTYVAIPGSPVTGDDGDAEYTVAVGLVETSVHASRNADGTIAVDITNAGSAIAEPVLEATPARMVSHRGSILPSGLPNVIGIEVPGDTATLSLQLRSETGTKLELHLYDCTTGQCFSYDIGFPAAGAHTLVVRKPNAGRWVAAVNAAPFPSAPGGFVLDEVVTTGPPVRRTSAAARDPGGRWRQTIPDVHLPAAGGGKTSVLLIELLDAALERGEVDHPWARAPRFKLRDRPVAVGAAIYRP